MANQIAVNVYAIDGIPQPSLSGLQISLPTKEVFVQEYEAQNNSNVHSLVTLYPNPNSGSKTQEFQVWETASSIESSANTDGYSMFGADVYSINQSFLKNGAKRFLFPNDKPSIWPYESGNIHSYITFKGNDYYANQTKTELETDANQSSGGSSYLVYVLQLRQLSALENPTTIVQQNTLGGTVVWTRDSTGVYLGTLSGAFPQDKAWFAPFGEFGGDATVYLPIWAGSGAIIGYYTMYWNDENSIALQFKALNGTLTDIFDLIGNSKLFIPEIRVYP